MENKVIEYPDGCAPVESIYECFERNHIKTLKRKNFNLGLVKDLIHDGRPFLEEGEYTIGELEYSDISEVRDEDWELFFVYGIETTRGNESITIMISEEIYKELQGRWNLTYMHFRSLLDYLEYTYNVVFCERAYLKPNQYAYMSLQLFYKLYRRMR